MLREKFKWRSHENESADGKHRGGASSIGVEGHVMGLDYLPISVQRTERPTCDWMVSMKKRAAAKPMPAAIMNIPRKPNKSARNPRETPAEITPISKAP